MEYILLDDLFGIKLWNENVFRRVYHHLSNNNYTPRKKPLLHECTGLLTEDQLQYLQTVDLDNGRSDTALNTNKMAIALGNNYSPRDTLYFNNLDPSIQAKLEDIGNSLIPVFSKLLHTDLRLADSNFRAIILRYEGANAQFGFHYDTEHPDCFRALILYDGRSTIPPFCYRDATGTLCKLRFKVNDGIIFRGTSTHHGVEPSHDPNTKRYLVGFQYIKQNSSSVEAPSLCNQLRGSSILRIARVFLPYSAYYTVLSRVAPLFPMSFEAVVLLNAVAVFVGLKYSTKLPGNQIPNTLHSLFVFYCFCFFMTFNGIMTVTLVSYVVLSEALLPIKN